MSQLKTAVAGLGYRLVARAFRFVFFRTPLPYRVVSRLAMPLLEHKYQNREITGFAMRLRISDVLQAGLLLDGEWEPKLTRWWAFVAARAQTIVDVGAHCGYYTLFANKVAPQARVHAFEPHPETYADLLTNIAINGCGDKVRPVLAAVSSRDGFAEFHIRDVEPASSSLTPLEAQQGFAFDRSRVVRTVSLDSYRATNGIPVIDLVKMDIEGAELAALRGMRSGLRCGAYRVLLIEVHPVGDKVAVLREFLRRCLAGGGYRVYRLQDTVAVPLTVEEQVPDYDTWMAVHSSGQHLVASAGCGDELTLPDEVAALFARSRWKAMRKD